MAVKEENKKAGACSMSQPEATHIQIELPETGAKRFIRKIIRDEEGRLIDASYSVYQPVTAPATTVAELSQAFPQYRFYERRQGAEK